jgi:hypothetical protein
MTMLVAREERTERWDRIDVRKLRQPAVLRNDPPDMGCPQVRLSRG